MKKTIKTIFFIIFMWLALAVVSKVNAASATITAKPTTATVGEKVTVTVSINAATWNLNVSGSATDSIVGYNEDGENATTTKTYTVTKNSAGTSTVNLTGDVTDASEENIPINSSVTITFKEKSTESNSGSNSNGNSSNSSSGNTTTTPKTPTFKSVNQKIYTTGDCNLRSSWTTSSSATSVKKGTELTLTGTSTETIDGYTWYRVTYQGATKYIASSLITYTKPKEDEKEDDKEEEKSNNKNLSSLKIDGIDITPSFDKDATQYTAHVDGDVEELKINAKAEDSKAKVSIEGNKGLKEGDNIIKVKVTAEDETTRTYFITVTKGEGTEIDTKLKLAQLSIDRVNFEDTFKPDTYSYELNLTSYVKNLDITAIPSQADATVDISGNEEFKAGQNVIVILLTSADGSETATYQIKVNVPAEVIEQAKEEPDTIFYVLIGVAVALVIIAIILIIRHHRASKEDDYKEEFGEEDKVEEIGSKRFSHYEDTYQSKENERSSRNSTLDDFFNAKDDEDERRPRGRHSR